MPKVADTFAPTAMISGGHIAGMAVVALANPLIYSGGGFYLWSVTLGAALLGAGVAYGLYALVFPKRAKAAWPGSFFMLAWVMLALALLQGWTVQPGGLPAPQASSQPQKGQTFTYEEAMGLPPAKK